jgi:SAM-dependent methyltransferase
MADSIKIEIGGNPKPGWRSHDHKRKGGINIIFDDLGVEDNTVDFINMSHVIEHIPVPKSVPTLKKLRAKLKPGGTLRLATPDLNYMAKAYLEGNAKKLGEAGRYGIDGLHFSLGVGGMFLNGIVSYGSDSFLSDRQGRELAGMAHVASYDFNMIQKVGQMAGFSKVERKTFDAATDVNNCPGQIFANLTK